MRTKKSNKPRVNVVTLGCSKNTYDSEVLMGQLSANSFPVVHEAEPELADIIVVNTCGFIENAKQESINTILAFAEQRKTGEIQKLYVTGCLSERYRSELESEIPEVDAYFGTKDLPALLKALKADYKKELVGERLLTTPRHYAYFKIAEGCDRPCSFCAIPLMRGVHRSTPVDDLLIQAQKLAEKGTKELILIAQDLTYYGLDLYKKRNLSQLLEGLAKINGIDWIRLHYAFPTGFPMDILDTMNEHASICKYLDMPLQHISDSVLKGMKRGTTKKRTTELLHQIREKVPGIALRTTLISGFPGETDADHQELLGFVKETKFERLGIFPYSHEENTSAFLLEDNVPSEVKMDRVNEVMQLQSGIAAKWNSDQIGKRLKVLVDRKESSVLIGRTEFDSPEVDNEVVMEPFGDVKSGDFVEVEIIDAEAYDLVGKIHEKIK